jgi:uncharacterized protein (DUF302 family)
VQYAMTARTAVSFAEASARIREALKAQGFGVLTEIDVQSTLQEKLGQQMEQYVILGACNPPLAHRALSADRSIGLLLPCNVVVRAAADHGTIVQALDPRAMAAVADHPELTEIADDAAARLRAALDALPPA